MGDHQGMADAVTVQAEAALKATNTQGTNLQIPGTTTPRRSRRAWSQVSRSSRYPAGLLFSSFSSASTHGPKIKAPFLHCLITAAAKAGPR